MTVSLADQTVAIWSGEKEHFDIKAARTSALMSDRDDIEAALGLTTEIDDFERLGGQTDPWLPYTFEVPCSA